MDLEEKYIRRALELAENALGETFPNPLVGAVVVAGERIVGEGYHRGPGRPARGDRGDPGRRGSRPGRRALSQSRALLPLRTNASLHGRHRGCRDIARRFQHVRSRQPACAAKAPPRSGRGASKSRPACARGRRSSSISRTFTGTSRAGRLSCSSSPRPSMEGSPGGPSGGTCRGRRSSATFTACGPGPRRSRSGSARSRSIARSSTGGSTARRCGPAGADGLRFGAPVPRGLSVALPQGARHHLLPDERRSDQAKASSKRPAPRSCRCRAGRTGSICASGSRTFRRRGSLR